MIVAPGLITLGFIRDDMRLVVTQWAEFLPDPIAVKFRDQVSIRANIPNCGRIVEIQNMRNDGSNSQNKRTHRACRDHPWIKHGVH